MWVGKAQSLRLLDLDSLFREKRRRGWVKRERKREREKEREIAIQGKGREQR